MARQITSFGEFLAEKSGTHSADVNEILYALYMAGEKWQSIDGFAEVRRQLAQKTKLLNDPVDYADQDGRAKDMAKETKKWMSKNGYPGTVKVVWWTARPGVLAKAVGHPVDSSKNPTDVLVQTSQGKFLGLSAKSTKGRGDIGFKNPGIGTVERDLNIDLKIYETEAVETAVASLGAPQSKSARKSWLRDPENVDVRPQIKELADGVLRNVRNTIYTQMKKMKQPALLDYLMESWMDSGVVDPPYIKVTGHGKAGTYNTTILDPLKNTKVGHLNKGPIKLELSGDNGIIISAEKSKIMKIRVKWESEALGSSLKLSGDPV